MEFLSFLNLAPFLWFNNQLAEAIEFYPAIFKDSKVNNVQRMGDRVFTASLQLEGQEFLAMDWDGGEPFTNAISFFIKCQTQEEVDYYWEKLTANGGQEVQCGWLKDKFGLSWQVIPNTLGEYLSSPDRAKATRVMQAMMKMIKIDIADLDKAAEG